MATLHCLMRSACRGDALNGLAISYAGLRVQQLITATTFMVLTNVNKFAVILFGILFLVSGFNDSIATDPHPPAPYCSLRATH